MISFRESGLALDMLPSGSEASKQVAIKMQNLPRERGDEAGQVTNCVPRLKLGVDKEVA